MTPPPTEQGPSGPRDAAGPPGAVATDLLLLAVGERSRWLTRGPVELVVAAGSLVDEVLGGDRPEVGDGSREALAAHLHTSAKARTAAVTTRAVSAGSVAPHRTKVWGLFPRDGLRVTDLAARERARGRLTDALRPGTRPATADAALASVAAVGGLARAHVPLPAGGRDARARTALREHLNSLAADVEPTVAEVVMALRLALRRSADGGDSGAVVFVPGSDRDGYGDEGGAGDSGGGDGGDGGGGGGD